LVGTPTTKPPTGLGGGIPPKAQKVETSIEVRIAHQARPNFVNVEINVLLSSQKLVTV
jgi:hypothetical protein